VTPLRRLRGESGRLPLERLPLVGWLQRPLVRVDPRLVLFESWHGQYSDSPRAIAEELHRRRLPFEQVWALEDPAAAPEWASTVEPDSPAYVRALRRAGFVVVNNTLPRYFRKRPGTFYLQTWHGTPLKRIAFDIANPEFRSRHAAYYRALTREVAAWDALVSPNAFSTGVFRQAFRYRGRIIESGYPRNDPLLAPEAAAVRRRARGALGVPEAARAVLYAPTFRDDAAGLTLALDLERLAAALGDDVLLLRAHTLVAADVPGGLPANVRDVSRGWEASDLYLAADVLISDYSSAIFDFAVTGRPMLFFTYDLSHYRDELRGFYFDFEADAPGPLLASTDDVIDALADLDGVARSHAGAYERFRERFCHLDDGKATSRVVAQVFER
jgi:CDP-glycerol glycerophosphotransferase